MLKRRRQSIEWLLHEPWTYDRFQAMITVDWDQINRPHLFFLYDNGDDNEELGRTDGVSLGVSWGNGNSDPVWSVDVFIPLPVRRRQSRPTTSNRSEQ